MNAPALFPLARRKRSTHPNHNLWNNHGTWFIHYTIYPTPQTKERVRRSLNTKCLEEARRRRDEWLANAFLPASPTRSDAAATGVEALAEN
jgi:hypothetical protein